jgi:histidine triad (HIT) family protein
MSDCLFCKIAAGQIPAKFVHQDEELIVIADINPQAPFHVLVIPRRHIPTLNDIGPDDTAIVARMVRLAASLAAAHGYAESGYRTVFNCNAQAGQTVFHIHLHLLAGRRLGWPPG